MKIRVLITCRQLQETFEEYRARFEEHRIEVDLPDLVQALPEAELREIIHRYDGVIAGDDPFSAAVLERAKRLRIIAKWGVGTDAIDETRARELGIRVQNTPGALGDDVADVAFGYVIMLARQLHTIDREVRAGGWPKIRGLSLLGRKLGIIGVGHVGSALAARGLASGMKILGYDVRPADPGREEKGRIERVSLEGLLTRSDFIVLCCAATPENRQMIGVAELARVQPGTYLVNVARGSLVDEVALAAALHEGRLAGAALDVFDEEPLSASSELRELEACILGSHNASNTVDAVRRVNELAIENLLRGLGV